MNSSDLFLKTVVVHDRGAVKKKISAAKDRPLVYQGTRRGGFNKTESRDAHNGR